MHQTTNSIAGLILLFAVAPPATTQDIAPTFGEAVEVSVVNLSVYVTRDGEPVRDLSREDFAIFEDGKRVPLTNFYAFQPPPRATAASEAGAGEARAEADAGGERAPDPVYVVAYVDNMNLRPHSRKMVIDRLETFVDAQLAPTDRVMIVTAGHRLRIRQEFSRDREATRRALAELSREPPLGQKQDLELSRILSEAAHRYTDKYAGDLDDTRIKNEFRNHQERLIAQASGTLGMLTDLVGSLGEVRGRKMVIHVSDGISASNRTQLKMLLARANANQVTFYAVDGGGSRRFEAETAAQRSNWKAGFWTPDRARGRELDREQSLYDLAEATGGKMLLARKNMDRELDGFRDAVAHYYSLGFSPRTEGSEVRRIRVEVRGKDLDVRFPKSYRLKTSQEKLYERVLTALRLGVASNELDIDVDFGTASRQEDAVVMPIMVRFPLGRLTLTPEDGYYVGSVTVMYGVLDGEGQASEVHLGNLPISVPEDQMAEIKGKAVAYEVVVAMTPDSRRLAVAARDDVGQTMAAVKREIKLVDG